MAIPIDAAGAASGARAYEFGPFTLDLEQQCLSRNGERIPIQPTTYQVLVALVANGGRLVTKQRLLDEVWPGTFVDENTLARHVSTLRKLLEDDRAEPEYVETVARRGYRFIGAVREVPADPAPAETRGDAPHGGPAASSPEARQRLRILLAGTAAALAVAIALTTVVAVRWSRSTKRPASITSIAVLPFVNRTPDPGQEYFADGMTDVLITELSKISHLKVISRTSAMTLKRTNKPLPEIARALGVDGIIEGSVTKSDNLIRITVRLVDGRTDRQVWAETYDRPAHELLTVQTEVARGIARQVNVTLTPEEQQRLTPAPAWSAEAQAAYVKGKYHINLRTPDDLAKGIAELRQAVIIEPKFSAAHAAIAEAYLFLTTYADQPPADVVPVAARAAAEAVRLEDSSAEAHAVLGLTKEHAWDWAGAERELTRAIALNPGLACGHSWYGQYLMRVGRFDEASGELARARELDPLDVGGYFIQQQQAFMARNPDEVIARGLEVINLNPRFDLAHALLGWALVQKKRNAEGLAALGHGGPAALTKGLTIASLAQIGQLGEARTLLAALEAESTRRYVDQYTLAIGYAGLGDGNRAMTALERAYRDRAFMLLYVGVDPTLDSLRTRPDFRQLIVRMGWPR